jgi:DNA-binding NarL/FixJ family response regulator
MRNTPLTIVIVDDSEAVRETLRRRLAALPGVTVSGEFDEAQAALDAVRVLRPEAMILDIELKRGNGLALLKEVHKELPDTKVLVFSNHAEPVFRRRFLDSGTYAFFDKSFELDGLCEAIRCLLED